MGKGEKVISEVLLIGIYAMIFGVALMVLRASGLEAATQQVSAEFG